jgi:DHA3 family macrolide efflux protein-like MFS transporter
VIGEGLTTQQMSGSAVPDAAIPRSAWTLVVTQGISGLGSTFTTFGLSVWIYRTTGSFTAFALLSVLAAIPELLFAPFVGIIADRVGKRMLLLVADMIAGATVLSTLLALYCGALRLSIVAVAIFVLALTAELRWSALSVATAILVPSSQLGRIAGFQQIFRGVNVMFGPVLGAIGYDLLGLPLLLGLDVLSYLIGIAGLLTIAMRESISASPAQYPGFLQELTYGFRWVFARPGLRRLLLFFLLINIGLAIYTVTFAPYVLSFASERTLGVTMGLQGGGAFITGALLATRRLRLNQDLAIVGGAFAFGACMFAWGIARGFGALLAAALLLGALTSVMLAASQTIWQTHVPVAIQGKVFAVRSVVAFGLTPFVPLAAIPLASTVFAPLVTQRPWAGALWGAHYAGVLGSMVSVFGLCVAASAVGLLFMGGLGLSSAKSRG